VTRRSAGGSKGRQSTATRPCDETGTEAKDGRKRWGATGGQRHVTDALGKETAGGRVGGSGMGESGAREGCAMRGCQQLIALAGTTVGQWAGDARTTAF